MPLTLLNSVGLVVTPSRTPHELTVRISSMSAVSRKSFIGGSYRRANGQRFYVRPWIRQADRVGLKNPPTGTCRSADHRSSLVIYEDRPGGGAAFVIRG